MNEDGTNRTELFTFPSVHLMYACIHRGVFYYINEDSNEGGERSSAVFAHPLNQKSGEPELLCAVKNTRGVSTNLLHGLYAYGNRLYFTEYAGKLNYIVHIVDLTTRKETVVTAPADAHSIRTPIIFDDSLLLNCNADMVDSINPAVSYDPAAGSIHYRCNLDGTQPQRVCDRLTTGDTCADERYVYHVSYRKNDADKLEPFQLPILNPDMTEVCTYDLSGLEADGLRPTTVIVLPLHRDQVLLQVYYRSGMIAFFAFSNTEAESGSIKARMLFDYTFVQFG